MEPSFPAIPWVHNTPLILFPALLCEELWASQEAQGNLQNEDWALAFVEHLLCYCVPGPCKNNLVNFPIPREQGYP